MEEQQYEEEGGSMAAKIIGWILKVPLILLVLVSWGASFYAASQKIQGITWSVPIVYTVFVLLYAIGAYLLKK